MHPALDELARRLEAAPPDPPLIPDGEADSPPGEEAAKPRKAAVAMILRTADTTGPLRPEVLLMRRAEHPLDRWSGQISLPGGHQDPGDTDLLATAVRESREEVAVDLADSARLVGSLPRVQARARGKMIPMGITPFVFEVTGAIEPSPGIEAQEVFWFPLARAQAGELDAEHRYRRDDGLIRKLPSWSFEERVVWGLTHMMLSDLLGYLELPR